MLVEVVLTVPEKFAVAPALRLTRPTVRPEPPPTVPPPADRLRPVAVCADALLRKLPPPIVSAARASRTVPPAPRLSVPPSTRVPPVKVAPPLMFQMPVPDLVSALPETVPRLIASLIEPLPEPESVKPAPVPVTVAPAARVSRPASERMVAALPRAMAPESVLDPAALTSAPLWVLNPEPLRLRGSADERPPMSSSEPPSTVVPAPVAPRPAPLLMRRAPAEMVVLPT